MSSSGTIATARLADENKVVILTPVTGGKNVDNSGDYVFRTANSDILAGRDIARAMNKLGFKKAAIVCEQTEYTTDIKNTFTDEFTKLGGQVSVVEDFAPQTSDFRTIISKLKKDQPEAIVILSQTGLSGGYFVKQARELSLKAVLFSDFNLASNENAKKIAGTFEGMYFADPAYNENDPAVKAFFDQYQQTYGKPPFIKFHAAATYDDIMLLSNAIKQVGDNSVKVHDWLLTDVKNYHGFMGTYSLDVLGNSDLGFNIKVVKNGQFVPL